ncbi:sugar lactone lactonase YvrE [Hymenobacter sp. UYAg731]
MPYRSFVCLAAWLLLPLAQVQAQRIVFVPADTASYFSTATVSTLAGTAGSKGATDGLGPAARFAYPMGVVVAANGTLYIVDEENMTIRCLSPLGEATTLAGARATKGNADGLGSAARFYHPVGVAVAADGTLYVADGENHTIRKIMPDGTVSTAAGTAGRKGTADGPGPAARFNLPHGVAVNADGVLYVADTFNHTIRKITPAGHVTTLAGQPGHKGSADGPGATARFFHPAAVAVDAQGVLYVADNGNGTVRKITPAGVVTTLAGDAHHSGHADGPGTTARFRAPTGVAVDARGNVCVVDHLNALIRKIAPSGEVTTLAGSALRFGPNNGTGAAARFSGPGGIAVDASGTLYVTDSGNNTIRRIMVK